MSLEAEVEEFTDVSDGLSDEIWRLRYSISSLELEIEHKGEVVNALEELNNYVQGLEYDIKNGSHLEKKNYFAIYEYIRKYLDKCETARNIFEKFNYNLKEGYVSQMVNFFNHLNENPENPEKLAELILSGRHEKSEYFINLGLKKGYIDPALEDYNPWRAEKEFEELFEYDEELGYDIAKKCRKKAFEYGEEALKNRPVLYVDERALNEANDYFANKTLGRGGVESGALFHFRRLGDRKILLNRFEGLETKDKRKSTGTLNHQEKSFRGESGRNIIFCHSHPNTGSVADRLSEGDIDLLTDAYTGVMGAGLREGITLLALPLPNVSPPEENIVWLACAVNSEGYAGNFYIHVVKTDGGNIRNVDDRYFWVGIHNKWIKPSYPSRNEGPYSFYLEEKKLQN